MRIKQPQKGHVINHTHKEKGYHNAFGYMGFIPKFNKYLQFSTEVEYLEFLMSVTTERRGK